ncbi:MAG TPA: amidase [Methylomirabilota bacterium]|nr:amidase [Methylomirabilota bacterium]
MNRRHFVQLTALATAQVFAAGCAHWSRRGEFGIEEASIPELQGAMQSGHESAVSLTEKYLRRITAIDQNGPQLNSVIELNPDALAIARELDAERQAKGPRGPLHGVPVLIKDNIDTHDRMMTTAGSLALVGSIPPQDSTVARRLREAGTVILGKTNLSEWANFRGNRSISGWSGRGGQTRNPYGLDRNPSGSSSGSGAAVSASLCAFAIGTETDGSIVSPASHCGIVGLKPTVGLISRAGIIPISHSQDTAGPMTRTVTDAALVLGALVGIDSRDSATDASRGKTHPDYAQFLDAEGLRGARIGVARRFFSSSSRANRVLESAIEVMKGCGAQIIDPAELPTHGKFGGPEHELMLYEFKAGLNAYLASLGPNAPIQSLQDVIDFNARNKERELRFFGQETMIAAQKKGPLTERAYLDAVANARRLAGKEGIDAVMDQHRLDALVAPTSGPAGLIDFVYGDRGEGGSSSPAAVAGYPNITVPGGDAFGLPMGLSFFGRAWSEPVLLKIAFAFEQQTKARRAPQFLPTLKLLGEKSPQNSFVP